MKRRKGAARARRRPADESDSGAHFDPAALGRLLRGVADPRSRAAARTAGLPDRVRRRVHALQGMEQEAAELRRRQRAERAAVEARFQKLWQPLFEQRRRILCGETAPDAELIRAGRDYLVKKAIRDAPDLDRAEVGVEPSAAGACRVPDFWQRVLQNHPGFAEMIQPHDIPILGAIEDLDAGYVGEDPAAGFWLRFRFAENEFLGTREVTKVYFYKTDAPPSPPPPAGEEGAAARGEAAPAEDGAAGHAGAAPAAAASTRDAAEVLLDRIELSPVQWRDGRDPTVQRAPRKKAPKKGKKGAPGKDPAAEGGEGGELVERASFFHFLAPRRDPAMQAMKEFAGAAEASEMALTEEEDLQMGLAMLNQVVPRAVEWYCDELAAHGEDEWVDDDRGADCGGRRQRQACAHQ
eukprot:TRINITY_DN179_c1_g1_i6.p1 TRINITY_DN179_c1_g1~~TRINITY_DN179_c1_g1_i6.p1  ORF type:complete len:431 (+),score=167.43 TRINITY_DN179_c1_g1_i6:67-1293(+)